MLNGKPHSGFVQMKFKSLSPWYALFMSPHTLLVTLTLEHNFSYPWTIPARPQRHLSLPFCAPSHAPVLSLRCSWAARHNRRESLWIRQRITACQPHRRQLQEQLEWRMLPGRTLPKKILPQHSKLQSIFKYLAKFLPP